MGLSIAYASRAQGLNLMTYVHIIKLIYLLQTTSAAKITDIQTTWNLSGESYIHTRQKFP